MPIWILLGNLSPYKNQLISAMSCSDILSSFLNILFSDFPMLIAATVYAKLGCGLPCLPCSTDKNNGISCSFEYKSSLSPDHASTPFAMILNTSKAICTIELVIHFVNLGVPLLSSLVVVDQITGILSLSVFNSFNPFKGIANISFMRIPVNAAIRIAHRVCQRVKLLASPDQLSFSIIPTSKRCFKALEISLFSCNIFIQ